MTSPQVTTRPYSIVYGRRDGLLDAQCWCGRAMLPVAPVAVRRGEAPSCGWHCRPTGRAPVDIKERGGKATT